MEDAATCVFSPPVENTNAPVQLIFTWLLTTKPASPTAPPARSARFLFTAQSCLTVLSYVSLGQYFLLKANCIGLLFSSDMYCLWNSCALILIESLKKVVVNWRPECLCCCFYYIVSLWDRWVYSFLVEVWHCGWLWGWIRRTCRLPWVACCCIVSIYIPTEVINFSLASCLAHVFVSWVLLFNVSSHTVQSTYYKWQCPLCVVFVLSLTVLIFVAFYNSWIQVSTRPFPVWHRPLRSPSIHMWWRKWLWGQLRWS